MTPVGEHQLLGLAAALLSMGTAGLIYSADVNDDATAAAALIGVGR